MTFKWEAEEERLLRFKKIPPTKRLEWLHQMNEFTRRFLPKRQRKLWYKLREIR